VSEQQLPESAIERLPRNATVMGDGDFGVFSVAWTATQKGYPAVLRLTAARARHLAGEPLQDGTDRPLIWKPSRADRKSHPELPPEANAKPIPERCGANGPNIPTVKPDTQKLCGIGRNRLRHQLQVVRLR
jgi:hypothetical protein